MRVGETGGQMGPQKKALPSETQVGTQIGRYVIKAGKNSKASDWVSYMTQYWNQTHLGQSGKEESLLTVIKQADATIREEAETKLQNNLLNVLKDVHASILKSIQNSQQPAPKLTLEQAKLYLEQTQDKLQRIDTLVTPRSPQDAGQQLNAMLADVTQKQKVQYASPEITNKLSQAHKLIENARKNLIKVISTTHQQGQKPIETTTKSQIQVQQAPTAQTQTSEKTFKESTIPANVQDVKTKLSQLGDDVVFGELQARVNQETSQPSGEKQSLLNELELYVQHYQSLGQLSQSDMASFRLVATLKQRLG